MKIKGKYIGKNVSCKVRMGLKGDKYSSQRGRRISP
jgi:hypothetical protein